VIWTVVAGPHRRNGDGANDIVITDPTDS